MPKRGRIATISELAGPDAATNNAGKELGLLNGRIQQFLNMAASAPPPAPIEEGFVEEGEEEDGEAAPAAPGAEGQPPAFGEPQQAIEMNLLLGVLEHKNQTLGEGPAAPGGVLLPTPEAAQAQAERQQQEAAALLSMMTALRGNQPAPIPGDDSSAYDSDGDVYFDSSDEDADRPAAPPAAQEPPQPPAPTRHPGIQEM